MMMNIVYRKDTLYVYVVDEIDYDLIERMERQVGKILERYKIDNLVLDVKEKNNELIEQFCRRYNVKYRKKILVR